VNALIVAAVILGALKFGSATDGTHRTPVLLELFTSEGCSSCPPADKLLQKLDHEQSVDGADLIVLSEHVDYWNHLGWADPYSSPAFSKRQQDYASQLDAEVYTPQLVIDGGRQVVGSDRVAVEHGIQDSLRMPKLPVMITAKRDRDGMAVHIEVGPGHGKSSAAVYLALAADQTRSHVIRGENAGRELEHVAVAESLVKIAEVTNGSGLQKDVRLALPTGSRTGNLRVVVFVQAASSRRIVGIAQARL
jgi:hypothetical protein